VGGGQCVLPLTWGEHRRRSTGHSILSAAGEVGDFPHEYAVVGAELEFSEQLFGFRQLQVSHGDGPLELTHFIGEVFNLFLV